MSHDPDAHMRCEGTAGDLDAGSLAALRDELNVSSANNNKLYAGDVVVCLEKRSWAKRSLFLSRLGVIRLWYACVEPLG